MPISIEYDDGEPLNSKKKKHPKTLRRNRECGFYLISEGCHVLIPIKFMRISEISGLEKIINKFCGSSPTAEATALNSVK